MPAARLQIVPIFSNITWSNVGVISVWCVEFKVNFGYVVLPPSMGMAPSERTISHPPGMLLDHLRWSGSLHFLKQDCCCGK